MIGATLVLAVALTAAPPGDAALVAGNGCASWASEVTPPPTIRVRVSATRIVRVNFALYTARVVSSEWNTVPEQLRRAGAVAVRQYAWVKAMRPRRSSAGCFDVWGNTRDQIYRVKTPPAYVWASVRATWTWRVLRAGRLIQTGYRTGIRRSCAADVDGYHLFARSGRHCALAGWSAARLLATYYRGRVAR